MEKINFTEMQVRVLKGLARLERKQYSTRQLAFFLKTNYQELRELPDQTLEQQITLALYALTQ